MEEESGVDLGGRRIIKKKERLPGLTYRVIGQGRHIDEAASVAGRLGIEDRIHFLGDADRDETLREILTANVGIVPVRESPYTSLMHPRSVYDYIALRRPVIASRLRALVAYFPDDSLIYFRPGDVDDLAEKIYSVFAYPEECVRRVNNASDIYNAHRWERESKKYVGVFRQLLLEYQGTDSGAQA
jgi:glycosyltransferase involved in cell wall biosynthesis